MATSHRLNKTVAPLRLAALGSGRDDGSTKVQDM